MGWRMQYSPGRSLSVLPLLIWVAVASTSVLAQTTPVSAVPAVDVEGVPVLGSIPKGSCLGTYGDGVKSAEHGGTCAYTNQTTISKTVQFDNWIITEATRDHPSYIVASATNYLFRLTTDLNIVNEINLTVPFTGKCPFRKDIFPFLCTSTLSMFHLLPGTHDLYYCNSRNENPVCEIRNVHSWSLVSNDKYPKLDGLIQNNGMYSTSIEYSFVPVYDPYPQPSVSYVDPKYGILAVLSEQLRISKYDNEQTPKFVSATTEQKQELLIATKSSTRVVGSFAVQDKWFIVINKLSATADYKRVLVYDSYIARICMNSQGEQGSKPEYNEFSNLMTAQLVCEAKLPGSGGRLYGDRYQFTSVVSINVHFDKIENTGTLVYAAFAPSPSAKNGNYGTGSAICVYEQNKVVEVFKGPQRLYSRQQPHHISNQGNSCNYKSQRATGNLLDEQITNEKLPLYIGPTDKITTIAVNEVKTFLINAHCNIIMIGHANGSVTKLLTIPLSPSHVIETYPVVTIKSKWDVITKIKFGKQISGPSDYFHVQNSVTLMRFPLARCQLRKTCRECVELRDPFCGWYNGSCSSNVWGKQYIAKPATEQQLNETCSESEQSEPATMTTTTATMEQPAKPSITQWPAGQVFLAAKDILSPSLAESFAVCAGRNSSLLRFTHLSSIDQTRLAFVANRTGILRSTIGTSPSYLGTSQANSVFLTFCRRSKIGPCKSGYSSYGICQDVYVSKIGIRYIWLREKTRSLQHATQRCRAFNMDVATSHDSLNIADLDEAFNTQFVWDNFMKMSTFSGQTAYLKEILCQVADYRCFRVADYFWARDEHHQYILASDKSTASQVCGKQSGILLQRNNLNIPLVSSCIDIMLSQLPTSSRPASSDLFDATASSGKLVPVLCERPQHRCNSRFLSVVVPPNVDYYRRAYDLSSKALVCRSYKMNVYTQHYGSGLPKSCQIGPTLQSWANSLDGNASAWFCVSPTSNDTEYSLPYFQQGPETNICPSTSLGATPSYLYQPSRHGIHIQPKTAAGFTATCLQSGADVPHYIPEACYRKTQIRLNRQLVILLQRREIVGSAAVPSLPLAKVFCQRLVQRCHGYGTLAVPQGHDFRKQVTFLEAQHLCTGKLVLAGEIPSLACRNKLASRAVLLFNLPSWPLMWTTGGQTSPGEMRHVACYVLGSNLYTGEDRELTYKDTRNEIAGGLI